MGLKFAVFLVSLMLFLMPITVSAQSGLEYELSSDDETYTSEYVQVSGIRYQIVNYQRGEKDTGSIVLDTSGNLVTGSSQLNEIYGVRAYQEVFSQNGITSNKYRTINSELTELSNNLNDLKPFLEGIRWLVVVGSGIATIEVAGLGDIPTYLIFDYAIDAVDASTDGINFPVSTSLQLKTDMEHIEAGMGSVFGYQNVLTINDRLKVELNETISDLTLDIWGTDKHHCPKQFLVLLTLFNMFLKLQRLN